MHIDQGINCSKLAKKKKKVEKMTHFGCILAHCASIKIYGGGGGRPLHPLWIRHWSETIIIVTYCNYTHVVRCSS